MKYLSSSLNWKDTAEKTPMGISGEGPCTLLHSARVDQGQPNTKLSNELDYFAVICTPKVIWYRILIAVTFPPRAQLGTKIMVQ